MRLIINGTVFLFDRFILRKSLGASLNWFCRKMGIAYIKLAQILAMQDIDGLFTKEDRDGLLHIVDDCNRVSFSYVNRTLREAYGGRYNDIVKKINHKPIGAASVSQVHMGVLVNGDKVVFKVKRRDVDKTIRKDIRTIKLLVRLFGRFFGFKNQMGAGKVMGMYTGWILQELDFRNEVRNIIRYGEFAKSVNGKVSGMKKILVPKVYEEYCTDDVICMEYVPYQTISRMEDTCEVRARISEAVSSYMRLNFHALLNDMPVAFHGDPHTGNIYLDDDGNIGFLDMGLVFYLSPSDAEKTRNFFFMAYFGRYDALYNTLRPVLKENSEQADAFYREVQDYCNNLKEKPITSYFMDLCLVCFRYNIVPDDYLFQMAKAFVALSGIDTIYENPVTAHGLLNSMVLEYVYDKTCRDGKKLFMNTLDAVLSIPFGDKDTFFKKVSSNMDILTSFIRSIKSDMV